MSESRPLSTPPHANIRLLQLDVLRGVAILLVLFRHEVVNWQKAGPLRPLASFLWKIGWTGVDLFFVLSGFLIGGLLFKEIQKTGRLDVKRFFIRRGLKIWPPYFVFLVFLFFRLLTEHRGVGGAFKQLLPNLVHLQNYFEKYTLRGHTWSLAVEEHFYLALPLFLILVTRRWKNINALAIMPLAAAGIIILCNVLRIVTNWHRPFALGTHQYPTHLRIDGLFFGVLLAYLYHMKPAMLARAGEHRWILLLIGALLVLPMGICDIDDHRWVWTIGYTMLYVGYGCILLACVYTAPRDGLFGRALFSIPSRVIAWIGVFSYSIYLWQADLGSIPTRHWIMPHLPQSPVTLFWALSTLIYFAVTIVTGILMSKLIEMPVLALRDRFFPGRIPVPTRPAPTENVEPAGAIS